MYIRNNIIVVLITVIGCRSSSSNLQHRQYNGDSNDNGGFKLSPSNDLMAKTPEREQPALSQASLQSSQLQSVTSQPSWPTTTSWLRSSEFTDSVVDGPITTSPVVSERTVKAAERRRNLLVELSAYKSRLVELHLKREEVDREVSECKLLLSWCE